MARSGVAALTAAAVLSTGCFATRGGSGGNRVPPAAIALGAGGFALMMAGAILLVKRPRCFDDEPACDDSDAGAYTALGIVFLSTGFAAAGIGSLFLATKRK